MDTSNQAQPDAKPPQTAQNIPQQAPQNPPQPQKLTSNQIKANRKNFFKKITSVFILIFMVGWVFAAYYGFSNDDKQQNENIISVGGYNFYALEDGTFGTYLNTGDSKIPVAFRLDPRNASTISLDQSTVQQILTAKKIYLTFDPMIEDKARVAVAVAEIARITSLYNIETVGAYIKDSDPPSPGVPIRTCEDTSSTITVLELGIDNLTSTSIVNQKGCIKMNGQTADDLIGAADKLGMNLIGIKL